MTQKHTNVNKPLTCQQCGGQNITVTEKLIYSKYFIVEDGKLFGITDPKCTGSTDETWIDCRDCRQESGYKDGPKESEWIASDEEKKIIWEMLDKASDPIDVSEFLEKEEK